MENVHGNIYSFVAEASQGERGDYHYMTIGTPDNSKEYWYDSDRGHRNVAGEEVIIISHK